MDNMETKMVTLAIHTNEKAQILKRELEKANIKVQIDGVDKNDPEGVSTGVRVRISEADLPRALAVVEHERLFSYAKEETYKIDDGRWRILVPVDFSDYSLNACKVAFNIAKLIDAKVKIFSAFYSPYFPSALPMASAFDYKGPEEEAAKTVLDLTKLKRQKLCTEIDQNVASGNFPEVNYSYAIREGQADDEIVEYSKEYKPVLIVMGTLGKDKHSDVPIGSVTAEVIEQTDVPVLAVPQNSTFKDPGTAKEIAFLTNFTQRDLISFDNMVMLLRPYDDVHITMLHVNVLNRKGDKMDADSVEKVHKYLSDRYPNLHIDYAEIDTNGDMLQGISQVINDNKMDIVAVNTKRRNLFARIFWPSISRKIVFKLDKTSLLVLRG